MSWEALGSVGDLLSGVGVIVTLFYLAVQIRHATGQLRSAAFTTTMDQYGAWRRTVVSRPDVAKLIVEGFADPGSLSPVDRLRATEAMGEMIMLEYNVWLRSEAGLFKSIEDPSLFRRTIVLRTIATPLGRELWPQVKRGLSPKYGRLVDEILQSNTSAH